MPNISTFAECSDKHKSPCVTFKIFSDDKEANSRQEVGHGGAAAALALKLMLRG